MNSCVRFLFNSLLCTVLFINPCSGQLIDLDIKGYKTSIETPYNLVKKKDIPVSLGAVALIGAGYFFKSMKPSIDPLVLINPDISKIPSFDLSAIHQSDPGYQKASWQCFER